MLRQILLELIMAESHNPHALPHYAAEAIKSAPPVGVTLWNSLSSTPVEKWVSVATLIWISVQIIFFIRDRYKARKARQRAEVSG